MVTPSTPGAPLFLFTCRHAVWRLSGDSTRSNNLLFKTGFCSLPPEDNFTFSTCCAVPEVEQAPSWLMFRPSPGFTYLCLPANTPSADF